MPCADENRYQRGGQVAHLLDLNYEFTRQLKATEEETTGGNNYAVSACVSVNFSCTTFPLSLENIKILIARITTDFSD